MNGDKATLSVLFVTMPYREAPVDLRLVTPPIIRIALSLSWFDL